MPRCLVYRRSPTCVHAWTRCKGRAVQDSGFCWNHLNVISGIYLGLEVNGASGRERAAHPLTRARTTKPKP